MTRRFYPICGDLRSDQTTWLGLSFFQMLKPRVEDFLDPMQF
jgi:hypothetical protein